MEKTAQRKTYKDPALNKIIQEKSQWNRQVSALINDIIHFKKSMNGWPSKYYKERTRITSPAPIDLSGILSNLAAEFQDLANQGNSIIQEQAELARATVKRHSERAQQKLEQKYGPTEGQPAAPAPAAPKPDLGQQLSKGLPMAASDEIANLISLGSDLEMKYELETFASNPFSRFITRLFNPKLGFGEGARIRRLRMEMLDNCVKAYKELKKLHKEIVKSSKGSVVNSHNLMKVVWNYWNAVNRLLSTYKAIRPNAVVKDEGGQLETDPELKKEKAFEEGREPEVDAEQLPAPTDNIEAVAAMVKDFRQNVLILGADPEIRRRIQDLESMVSTVMAAPTNKKVQVLQNLDIRGAYNKALQLVNAEWGTSGSSFQEIVNQRKAQPPVSKEAQLQRWLGKARHQAIPTATSGQRLEVYRFISQIKKDLNEVMNLLEKGFDEKQLSESVGRVNREMAQLRIMMRSLYYSVKPEEASSPFF